ncbi:hypothetical protein WA171_006122 [Blastocystis sp. BT1]
MALLIATNAAIPSLASQMARASPLILHSVHQMNHFNNCSVPTIQKRNLGILDIVIQTTIDATALTTGLAGLRRMTGFDCRTQADKIANPEFRRYCYSSHHFFGYL